MPPIPQLNENAFTLDVSGLGGFLGGEEAISAMESVHFYEHRKFLGFYNTPGSYKVAKHYGKLARGAVWDALFPSVDEEPASFLKMDGTRGPRYKGAVSGTTIEDIGHIGRIFGQLCRDITPEDVSNGSNRSNQAVAVTIVDLIQTKFNLSTRNRITVAYPAHFSSARWRYIIAFVTMALNIGICVLCAVVQEWYAFALILLGILCNGLACICIGSAKIYLTHHIPSKNSPSGNGILIDRDQFIVLRGTEEAVNHVVKGKFEVEFGKDTSYNSIGFSAAALTIQFLAQLFLAPQSNLLGQILFLATLVVSWMNNACLSSIDKESLQKKILREHLPLDQKKVGRRYMLGSRTSAVVFATLCALPLDEIGDQRERDRCVREILESMLPTTKTKVWKKWANKVVEQVRNLETMAYSQEGPFRESGPGLLKDLLEMANPAFKMYLEEFQDDSKSNISEKMSV